MWKFDSSGNKTKSGLRVWLQEDEIFWKSVSCGFSICTEQSYLVNIQEWGNMSFTKKVARGPCIQLRRGTDWFYEIQLPIPHFCVNSLFPEHILSCVAFPFWVRRRPNVLQFVCFRQVALDDVSFEKNPSGHLLQTVFRSGVPTENTKQFSTFFSNPCIADTLFTQFWRDFSLGFDRYYYVAQNFRCFHFHFIRENKMSTVGLLVSLPSL